MECIFVTLMPLMAGIFVVRLFVHKHRAWLGIVLGILITSSPFVAFLISVFWTMNTQRVETFGLALGLGIMICVGLLEISLVGVAGLVMLSSSEQSGGAKHEGDMEISI